MDFGDFDDEAEANGSATQFPGSATEGHSFQGKPWDLISHGYWEYQNHGRVPLPQLHADVRGDLPDYRVDIDVSSVHTIRI